MSKENRQKHFIPSNRITWNRVSGEFKYKSMNEFPRIYATFKKADNNKYVCVKLKVIDTDYSTLDLQHKLEKISAKLERDYGSLIQ